MMKGPYRLLKDGIGQLIGSVEPREISIPLLRGLALT
jgi:hypothetical protein